MMYNRYLKIKDGKVYSTVDIPAKTPIIEMTGDRYNTENRGDPNISLQVSHQYHIGPSGAIDDVIGHSCDPNCYLYIVGSRAILYSLYLIKAGSELHYDYSLSSTDTHDTWKMECNCGSPKCRKVISGFQYLNDEVKENYKSLGIVPIFLAEKAFQGW